jgi:hypothetical protein
MINVACGLFLLTVAIFFDVVTFICLLKRNVLGYGSSGIPVVQIFLYLIASIYLFDRFIHRLEFFFLCLTFYVLTHFIIPGLHRKSYMNAENSNNNTFKKRDINHDSDNEPTE